MYLSMKAWLDAATSMVLGVNFPGPGSENLASCGGGVVHECIGLELEVVLIVTNGHVQSERPEPNRLFVGLAVCL